MLPLPAETIIIEGIDALDFAHAQISSDVRTLEIGTWQWSAWLDPQGRVRALFQLARSGEQELLLLLRGGAAAPLADALRRYLLRARADIATQAPRVLCDAAPLPQHAIALDQNDIVFGMDTHGMRVTAVAAAGLDDTTHAWRLADIRAGYPWLPDSMLDATLAPALSLQRLGAVSLDKGCFPGQEIVARLHYRGGCKHHLQHISAAAAITPGTTLHQADGKVGTVLDCVATGDGSNCEALAVIQDVAVQNARVLGIAAGPVEVSLMPG